MKTLRFRSFFVLGALLAFTTTRAQTAEDIVGKYTTAIGGKDAVNSIKSLVMSGTSTAMGNDGSTTVTLVVDKGYKTETDFNGTKFTNAVTPTSGWMINAYMGAPNPTAIPAEAVKAQQMQLKLDPLVNYAANGLKIELTGKDTADYKIKATGSAGAPVTFYINQKTYLLDKLVTTINAGGQESEITISFLDYRKVDGGALLPFGESIDYPQASVGVTFKTITVNGTVDPTVFDMPKQ